MVSRASSMQTGGGNERDATNSGSSKRRCGNARSFDQEAFHQLQLERAETQRRIEQQRRQLNRRKSCIRWNSMDSSPSSMIYQSIDSVQRSPQQDQESNDTIETDAVDGQSARRELLRLGRRFASVSSPARRKNVATGEQTPTFSAPTNDIIAGSTSHVRQKSLDLSTDETNRALQYLPRKSVLVVTPDEKKTPNDIFGALGSHYLLLARMNSCPTLAPNEDDRNVTDSDDGSSASSYNTPTPHLQAESACDSHGENEELCDDPHQSCHQDEVAGGEDHFTSFCKAQVLISKLEQNTLESQDSAMNDGLVESHQGCTRRVLRLRVAQLTLIAIAGVAMYCCFGCFPSCHEISSRVVWIRWLLLVQLEKWWQSASFLYWSLTRVWTDSYSSMHRGVVELSSLFDRKSLQFMAWIEGGQESFMATLSCIRTDWMKETDILSLAFESMYRLEKLYYDSTLLFNATMERSTAVWNMTLPLVSCLQHFVDTAPRLSDLFVKSKELVVISKATITEPLENGTLALFKTADEVNFNSSDELSPPEFWTTPSRGGTFVRHELPSLKHILHRHLHSIPSSNVGATAQWRVSTGALNDLEPHRNRPKHIFPAIGLGNSRISIESFRLDSVSISSDIQENMAATMVIQKIKPTQHPEHHLPQHQPSRALTTKNYYTSSYPKQQQLLEFDEKDAFDGVDVMVMAGEFGSELLRKINRKRRRTKRRD